MTTFMMYLDNAFLFHVVMVVWKSASMFDLTDFLPTPIHNDKYLPIYHKFIHRFQV